MSVTTAAAPMFARSLSLVEAWIAELAPKPAAPAKPAKAAAPAAAAGADGDKAATAKPAKQARGGKAAPAEEDTRTSMARVAFRVGRVLEVKPHPDSDKLYVEQIDLGEPEPRTIISGLRDFVTEEEFTNKLVVVAANLEPRKMRGIPSAGMVMCASTEGKGDVKILDVPEGVPPGERITFPGHDGEAEPVLKKKLAKHYDEVAPHLRTNADGVACYGDLPFVTSKGPVTSVIKNGGVS
eukprot:CAMPEP_0174832590 /NCGR_PEP_ID=MMETSP1114-20130205/3754_1 /TAXON_ID=312471 /ORGANISM="Neobodo designis, Strain CCAP 1951/1" /LENGTH=238 /DNA_ID=CAMNT_0016066451 /DNA_START=39 /DNA_END=755 /DNA_ORIENTATION=-